MNLFLAALGLVVALAGMASYYFLMDIPSIRSTAWPSLAGIVAGLGLCGYALWTRRSAATISLASVTTLLSALFVVALFVLTRLPEASVAPDVGQTPPDIALPNQIEQTVRLADFRGRGPVLLVFYRGHW